MTADERIEGLLNHFGQTISDLPKTAEEAHAYDPEHRIKANTAAREWGRMARPMSDDYICHLCDVIDRMEIALDIALRTMPCENCVHWDDHFSDECPCYSENGEFHGDGFELPDTFFIGGCPHETDAQ